MITKNSASTKAVANLNSAIDASRRFPRNPFLGEWDWFYFFDSDWMFEGAFVQKVKAALEIEGGICAGIVYFDAAEDGESASFLIGRETAGDAYQLFLAGQKAGGGWLNSFGAFGCTSDVGQWCMYCERRNEMAVIALKKNCLLEKYRPLIAQFKAVPIKEALNLPLTYCFGRLPPDWRETLVNQYANIAAV